MAGKNFSLLPELLMTEIPSIELSDSSLMNSVKQGPCFPYSPNFSCDVFLQTAERLVIPEMGHQVRQGYI